MVSRPLGKRVGRPRAVSDECIVAKARACYLRGGAGVSVQQIAQEVGVSHTTLFNRFGSKEDLMIAALGVPPVIPWAAGLESGPDDGPITAQLLAHGTIIAAFFQDLHAGMTILQAAGVPMERIRPQRGEEAPAARAFAAFVGWLRRAREQRRIGPCDVDALASTILGSLYNWSMTAGVCGHATTLEASRSYVEHLVEILWCGIGVPNGRACLGNGGPSGGGNAGIAPP